MQTLPIRIISALAVIALFFASFYYWGPQGLQLAGFFTIIIGIFEFSKMAFPQNTPKPFLFLFLIVCILFLGILVYVQNESFYLTGASEVHGVPLALMGFLFALFFSCSLWITRNKIENDDLLKLLKVSSLGFVYCAFFPGLALKILSVHENSWVWFIFLCFVAPAGDIFAYFGGIWFGKRKMMPKLSPSKTIAGSVSGYLGSALVGGLFAKFFLYSVSIPAAVTISILVAFLGQSGDLFESLLKRVARVKDSGNIMPGHGGVLDRLDAIYFAGPFVYLVVLCQATGMV